MDVPIDSANNEGRKHVALYGNPDTWGRTANCFSRYPVWLQGIPYLYPYSSALTNAYYIHVSLLN